MAKKHTLHNNVNKEEENYKEKHRIMITSTSSSSTSTTTTTTTASSTSPTTAPTIIRTRRATQKYIWMFVYGATTGNSTINRAMFEEYGTDRLDIDECYSTTDRALKYTLVHLVKKRRITSINDFIQFAAERYGIVCQTVYGYEQRSTNGGSCGYDCDDGFASTLTTSNNHHDFCHCFIVDSATAVKRLEDDHCFRILLEHMHRNDPLFSMWTSDGSSAGDQLHCDKSTSGSKGNPRVKGLLLLCNFFQRNTDHHTAAEDQNNNGVASKTAAATITTSTALGVLCKEIAACDDMMNKSDSLIMSADVIIKHSEPSEEEGGTVMIMAEEEEVSADITTTTTTTTTNTGKGVHASDRRVGSNHHHTAGEQHRLRMSGFKARMASDTRIKLALAADLERCRQEIGELKAELASRTVVRIVEEEASSCGDDSSSHPHYSKALDDARQSVHRMADELLFAREEAKWLRQTCEEQAAAAAQKKQRLRVSRAAQAVVEEEVTTTTTTSEDDKLKQIRTLEAEVLKLKQHLEESEGLSRLNDLLSAQV